MNRLWVRLSLAISAIILFIVVIPSFFFLARHSDDRNGRQHGRDRFEQFDPAPSPIAPINDNSNLPNAPAQPEIGDEDFDSERNNIIYVDTPWWDTPGAVLRVALAVGLIGMGSSVVVGRRLGKPMSKLSEAAEIIGSGDLSHRVQVQGGSREVRELGTSFNKMAADLQRADEQRQKLMADVSHELRTPLTVLEGNLRAALDHVYELDDEELANLYGQTRHLIRLVNDLRELALAEAHQLPLNREKSDLRHLLEQTVAVFEPLAQEQSLTLELKAPAVLPHLHIDSARIRQVLHNLISNALQHTPPQGSIVVEASVAPTFISLAVRDSGEGIEREHLAHVFDRFYRTDASRTRDTGGSGLGLAIVKAIVEAHGGSVSAKSAGIGSGTEFIVQLPLGLDSAEKNQFSLS